MSAKKNLSAFNKEHKKGNFLTNMSGDAKVIAGVGVVTLAILIGGVWIMSAQSAREQKKLEKPLLGKAYPIQPAEHIQAGETHPSYNSNPPTSGWMYNETAGPGIKSAPVADENLMHSMEHGAVILYYKDTLSKADVEKITQAFNSASGKSIMTPRKNLDVPVALTSWGRLLKLKKIDRAKIKEFIETNYDRAPEKMAI